VRPRGLRLIIGYKLVKAPFMLTLGLILLLRSDASMAWLEHLAFSLASGGGYLHLLGVWLEAHLGMTVFRGARWVILLDGVSTGIEAALLLSGKSWGEWLVVAGVSVLIPAEVYSLLQHFTWLRVGVLLVNLAVVVYLVRRRVRSHLPKS
jgi:uncharacterized membrane protein (DUF2068 family)